MYRFVQLAVAEGKNISEDTEMISAVCANTNESNIHPRDESVLVPTVITNVGIASSCGNVTSGASLGNLRLDNTTPETKSFGILSEITNPADTEILSNGGQQQVKKGTVYVFVCYISSLVFFI
jgi:exosome complex exonuclease RRP6